jgi:hypothetical protein
VKNKKTATSHINKPINSNKPKYRFILEASCFRDIHHENITNGGKQNNPISGPKGVGNTGSGPKGVAIPGIFIDRSVTDTTTNDIQNIT